MAQLEIALIYGGRSVEHEVSIASAASIAEQLDPSRYRAHLVGIDREGAWHLGAPGTPLEAVLREGPEVFLPARPGVGRLLHLADASPATPLLDAVFPIVHGTGGEDGRLQGLLELAGVAYVGAGVLASAAQMDKDVTKRLLAHAGLPVLPWACLGWREIEADAAAAARRGAEAVGLPAFVKPANTGSSVGISRAVDLAGLAAALREAARYDDKVLVEQAIDGRDLEVAVIGDAEVETSVVGEIRTGHAFYDYEAKYVDDATELLVPAPVDDATAKALREMAARAYRVVEGAGLARVDFLVDRGDGRVWLNEINSLPGFTQASMFPRLWAASGRPYPELLDTLLELARARAERRAALATRPPSA